MRKTCVFITGTNGVGKTAIARAFIARYGGVDRIKNNRGSSSTAMLAGVVEEALRNTDVVLCEGSFMNTMGLNLTNAMFKAERHLVVSLYAMPDVIYKRVSERSNGKNGKERKWSLLFKKQRQSMLSARRWQEIGVRVIQFNTGECSVEHILEKIIETIEEINK